MALRPYQDDLLQAVRGLLMQFDAVMMQLATGGGKTRIFCEMTALAIARKNPVWVLVPRNELLDQSSEELKRGGTAHGKISADHKESRAFNVHVVSKDTLIRRIKAGKVKNWPKIVIIDEAHLNLDQQIFIRDSAPAGTKFIGVTATPERLDGRGLNEMYEGITYGPTIAELVEMGYLSDVKYFGIPGITQDDFKSTDFSGTELKGDVLDEILRKRNIYGDVIAHYREHAHNKTCITFCRSLKLSKETAERFCDAGYLFENIDGTMSKSKRRALIDGVKTGRLHGLTSVDLVCYGLDVPKVECIIKLRFTLSKALNSQMDGRGLRPYEEWIDRNGLILPNSYDRPDGSRLSYKKEHCIILDPVGALSEHGHPLADYNWNFYGTEKRGKKKGIEPASLKLCQECFMHYEGEVCPNCNTRRASKPQKNYEEIDGRLIEIKGPIKLNDRPPEEKREFQDKYSELMDAVKSAGDSDELYDKYVKELLELAADAGQQAMSVYWRLSEGMQAVNEPLLHSIRRGLDYKQGWVFMQRKTISGRLGR